MGVSLEQISLRTILRFRIPQNRLTEAVLVRVPCCCVKLLVYCQPCGYRRGVWTHNKSKATIIYHFWTYNLFANGVFVAIFIVNKHGLNINLSWCVTIESQLTTTRGILQKYRTFFIPLWCPGVQTRVTSICIYQLEGLHQKKISIYLSRTESSSVCTMPT